MGSRGQDHVRGRSKVEATPSYEVDPVTEFSTELHRTASRLLEVGGVTAAAPSNELIDLLERARRRVGAVHKSLF